MPRWQCEFRSVGVFDRVRHWLSALQGKSTQEFLRAEPERVAGSLHGGFFAVDVVSAANPSDRPSAVTTGKAAPRRLNVAVMAVRSTSESREE